MSFKLHGNYCGPGWSAGKWQQSVKSSVPPVDAFDASCMLHDAAYAAGEDLVDADLRFASDNIGLNPMRLVAGVGVGLQGLVRMTGLLPRRAGSDKVPTLYSPTPERSQIENFSTLYNKQIEMAGSKTMRVRRRNKILAKIEESEPRITKSAVMEVANRQRSRLARAFAPVKIAAAPVSIGNTLTASKAETIGTPTGVRIMCREFLTTVKNPLSGSSYQISALAPLHPMYYKGTVMANTARGYAQYRFNKVTVHFVTRQTTSQAGEIVLAYSENVLEPCEDGNSSAFLPRVMTKGTAVLGPVWQNHSMTIQMDSQFRKVDAFGAADFNDNIAGEVQAYSQALTTDDLGYLIIDYDLEFKTTLFTPHSTSLPLPGAGVYANGNVNSTTTIGGGVLLTTTVGYPSTTTGVIYRLALDSDNSLFGNKTAATAFAVATEYANISGVETTYNQNLSLTDGSVLYGVFVNGILILYTSIEAALAGSGSGQVLYRATDAVAATFSLYFTSYIVRLPATELISAD